ncbi:E3 ubiquitin-protein ligase COP1-like [Dysidea avara]|uniref:E3 ubiquitin-protein ligase COP1-like n=1 Tax=Dysidea avara TaxID=196820 RepID=UPI00332FFF5D
MSGRRTRTQPTREPTPKRRRASQRGDSGSSSNGESSTDVRTTTQQQSQQRTDIRTTQQQTQQRPPSPTTSSAGSRVAPSNPMPTRPTLPARPVRQQTDPGDQIAPSSPRSTRKIMSHVSELQVAPDNPVDPLLHQQLNALPKESFKLQNSDFICPICFDILKEPFITPCGHSYCYDCISSSLKQYSRCPLCNEPMTNDDSLIPNVTLSEVIYKYRKQQEAEHLHERETPIQAKQILEQLEAFGASDMRSVFIGLTQLMRGKDKQKKISDLEAQKSFLTTLKQRKIEDIKLQTQQVDLIAQDLKSIDGKLVKERSVLGTDLSITSSSGIGSLPLSDDLPGPSGLQSTQSTQSSSTSGSQASQDIIEQCLSVLPSQTDVSAAQKWCIESHFDELADNYVQARMPVLADPEANDGGLEKWGKSLNGLTELSKFRELGTLMYGDPAQGPSIVSSIDFDKDQEFFAVGGVTRQLKVYDYQSVVSRPVSVHYPVQDLACASKISSISFNYYIKSMVASCDYDGAVIISDVHTGTHQRQWREHEKRCWSVHFNHCDPKIVASGSDDFKIKIWVTNMAYSVGIVNAEANVCAVRFHPASRYYLAYGCADHKVHYYDLRDLRSPLCVLEGHKKAVSYCQFVNHRELVSLSTDSEMKLWDVNTGRCLKTYHGHKNDKNFVGLTVNGNHIVCGSENNSFYCYYKDVSKHILSYRFNVPRSILPGTAEPPDNAETQFVSAVCWKPRSSVLLAANSQGYIKMLEVA